MSFKYHIRTDENTCKFSFKNSISQIALMGTEHDLYWQVTRFVESLRAPVHPEKTPLHAANGDAYTGLKGNKQICYIK